MSEARKSQWQCRPVPSLLRKMYVGRLLTYKKRNGFFSYIMLLITAACFLFWSGIMAEVQHCVTSVVEEQQMTDMDYKAEGWGVVITKQYLHHSPHIVLRRQRTYLSTEQEKVTYYITPADNTSEGTTGETQITVYYENKVLGMSVTYVVEMEETVRGGTRMARITHAALAF